MDEQNNRSVDRYNRLQASLTRKAIRDAAATAKAFPYLSKAKAKALAVRNRLAKAPPRKPE